MHETDIDYMLSVMQQFRDGAEIELAAKTPDALYRWMPVKKPVWNWLGYNYRVKRVPLELWVNFYDKDKFTVYTDKETAERNLIPSTRLVYLREVLDD